MLLLIEENKPILNMQHTTEKKRAGYDATSELVQRIANEARVAFAARGSSEDLTKKKQIYAVLYAEIMTIYFSDKDNEVLKNEAIKLFDGLFEKYKDHSLGKSSEYEKETARQNQVATDTYNLIFKQLKIKYKPGQLEDISLTYKKVETLSKTVLVTPTPPEFSATEAKGVSATELTSTDVSSRRQSIADDTLSHPTTTDESRSDGKPDIAETIIPETITASTAVISPIPIAPPKEIQIEELMTEAQADAILETTQKLIEELKSQASQMAHTILGLSQEQYRQLQFIRELYQNLEKELKYRDTAVIASTKDESLTHQITQGVKSIGHLLNRKTGGQGASSKPKIEGSTFSKISRALAIKQYLTDTTSEYHPIKAKTSRNHFFKEKPQKTFKELESHIGHKKKP